MVKNNDSDNYIKITVQCPRQPNSTDCGFYVIANMQAVFVQLYIENSGESKLGQSIENYFYHNEVKEMRKDFGDHLWQITEKFREHTANRTRQNTRECSPLFNEIELSGAVERQTLWSQFNEMKLKSLNVTGRFERLRVDCKFFGAGACWLMHTRSRSEKWILASTPLIFWCAGKKCGSSIQFDMEGAKLVELKTNIAYLKHKKSFQFIGDVLLLPNELGELHSSCAWGEITKKILTYAERKANWFEGTNQADKENLQLCVGIPV